MKLKIKWSNVKYSKRGAWLKSRYCTAQLASLVAAFECVFTFFNIRTSHLHREIKTGGGPRLSKILLIKHCKERNRNPQNLTWIKKTSIFEILMVMGGFIKQSHYWLPHAHTNTRVFIITSLNPTSWLALSSSRSLIKNWNCLSRGWFQELAN